MEIGPPRCPRCRSVVGGDYKFCPACAYRLREIADEPAAPAARVGWRFLLGVALGALVVLACLALGVVVFAPNLFPPAVAPPPRTTPPSIVDLSPPKTVADIGGDLVELDTMGVAYVYSFYAIDEALHLDDETRDRLIKSLGGDEFIRAIVPRSPRFMRYEVTNGQYAEFIDDVVSHPERVPDFWRQVDKVAKVQDVDVMNHVPGPWITVDSIGERTWHLDDADRNLPVTHVSFVDAQGFAEWASARLGLPLRLPLVMEWVRAARSGKEDYVWPWGKQRLVFACNNIAFDKESTSAVDRGGRARPVHFVYAEGNGGATLEGLYGMAGNVAEWTFDHDVGVQFPALGEPYLTWKPNPPGVETLYFACGGSFRSGIDDCQVESRERVLGTNAQRDDIGFRLVAEPR